MFQDSLMVSCFRLEITFNNVHKGQIHRPTLSLNTPVEAVFPADERCKFTETPVQHPVPVARDKSSFLKAS